MDNTYQNCLYHVFTLHNIEIRNLDNNLKILLSPHETKLIKICNQERDPQIVKGTYLIKNIHNCIFSINDHIIRNWQSHISTEIKFIDYQEKHNQITTLNITQPTVFNISQELTNNQALIEQISFSNSKFKRQGYMLYLLLVVILTFVLYRLFCYLRLRLPLRTMQDTPKKLPDIPLEDISAHF